MIRIKFTKMNGLGNDFIIIDYEDFEKTKITPSELALKLCNRNFSIGADGLIIACGKTQNADVSWIFYNSDGSVAEMCGNGMRCFARFVHDKGITTKDEFSVETLSGIKETKFLCIMQQMIISMSQEMGKNLIYMQLAWEIRIQSYLLMGIAKSTH